MEITKDDATDESLTRAAMDAGAPIIFQAHLSTNDGWHGYPDFLYRCLGNDCPCGGRHYTPWDTKLARSARPHLLVQLCAYDADLLEALRGYRPGVIVFVLGNQVDQASTLMFRTIAEIPWCGFAALVADPRFTPGLGESVPASGIRLCSSNCSSERQVCGWRVGIGRKGCVTY